MDVETPDPPSLGTEHRTAETDTRIEAGADVHREDLATALHEGAWVQGFQEWAEHTDLDGSAWRAVADLGLIEEFDFFWDGSADRVGYSSPGIPENWRQADLHPALDSWSTVSSVNAALSELGRTVAAVLTQEYVDWTTDEE